MTRNTLRTCLRCWALSGKRSIAAGFRQIGVSACMTPLINSQLMQPLPKEEGQLWQLDEEADCLGDIDALASESMVPHARLKPFSPTD